MRFAKGPNNLWISQTLVEVVYALADKQKLLRLSVPYGTTVRSRVAVRYAGALSRSGSAQQPAGYFGKAVSKPDERAGRGRAGGDLSSADC